MLRLVPQTGGYTQDRDKGRAHRENQRRGGASQRTNSIRLLTRAPPAGMHRTASPVLWGAGGPVPCRRVRQVASGCRTCTARRWESSEGLRAQGRRCLRAWRSGSRLCKNGGAASLHRWLFVPTDTCHLLVCLNDAGGAGGSQSAARAPPTHGNLLTPARQGAQPVVPAQRTPLSPCPASAQGRARCPGLRAWCPGSVLRQSRGRGGGGAREGQQDQPRGWRSCQQQWPGRPGPRVLLLGSQAGSSCF